MTVLFYQVLQNIFLTNSKRSKILQPDLCSKLASTTHQTPPSETSLATNSLRIQYKVATLCYNSFTESYPVQLSAELLTLFNPSRQLTRSISDTRNFRIPFHKNKDLSGQRTFSFTGPTQWNSLERVSTPVVVVVVVVSCDVSDLCADQRSQVRGYEDCLPHGPSFRLLLHSHHSGFVGTISTFFCYVNIKLVLFFVD